MLSKEFRDMLRYILGFVLALGLIVVVIVLIIRGFSSPIQKTFNLDNYADTGVTVQLTIDSPVSASVSHHDIIINVGNTQASILITQGYEGQVIASKSYPMNVNAYAVFLHSITLNGFTDGNTNPSLSDDRGHCALGDRYVYEIISTNGNDLEHFWYTSCDTGTFAGNVPVIQELFDNQIPDYDTLTSDITL